MRRALALSGLIAACGSESGVSPQYNTDVFNQAPTDRVDILFVIDDSLSMAEEQLALASGFTTFLEELDASETSWQIGVVSTSVVTGDPLAGRLIGEPGALTEGSDVVRAFGERVQIGTDGSNIERGLESAALAVRNNPGFVRLGANLVVIFVTDEDDCSEAGRLEGRDPVACYREREALTPVSELVERIRGVKYPEDVVRFGGILGPLDGSCSDAYAGERYVEAVASVGGSTSRICDADWTPALRDLGVIASGILDQFALSDPAHVDTIEVFVDEIAVSPGESDGWTYEPAGQLVHFHGTAVPPRGSTIRIEYEVAPSI